MADPVDLVIVDVNMPQMDGVTFLKALRRKEAPLSCVPALVASAKGAAQDFAAAREARPNLYLTKPVSPNKSVEFSSLLSGRRE